MPQFLLELAWLQLEPLASAILTAARLKEHCSTTVSPLNSKVVLIAYKHHEGTARVKTSQKDLADYGLQDNLLLAIVNKGQNKNKK